MDAGNRREAVCNVIFTSVGLFLVYSTALELIIETGYKYRTVAADESPPSTKSDIGIQISLGTYKLFYEAGTEDFLWRQRPEVEQGIMDDRAKARHEERKNCVLLQ